MLTLVNNPRDPVMVDLTIQEFDQWTNGPESLAIYPTSICWFPPEYEPQPAD